MKRTGLALQPQHFEKGSDLHFLRSAGEMRVLVGLTDLSENAASGAITGNLASYESVFQDYTSPELVAWRRPLFHNEAKADPCKTCSVHSHDAKPKARPLVDYVNKQLNGMTRPV